MEKRKTAGVITFHNYDNYGAILQSYALQKWLRKLGLDTEIIDYDCAYISHPFSLNTLKKKGLFNYIYGAIGHICYIPRSFRCNQFRKNLQYSKALTSDNRDEMGQKYDAYIAGSDQIWDYKLTDFDRTYFLDFVKEGHKKFSYAASIGENLPPENIRGTYRDLLKSFNKIIVRESYGADVVEELTGSRPETACDPTLLLDGNAWAKLAIPPRTNKKYILVYQLGISKELVNFVKKLQSETGLKVIYIPFPLVGLMKCNIKLFIGPREWLGLFHDAEYVVSDSFHGIVFAMQFHKKFFGMTKGHHRNKRVEELLQLTGLENRTIESSADQILTTEIDYDYADRQLKQYRQTSLKQLKSLVDMID